MRLDTRTWALIPLAVAINVAAGWLTSVLRIPLYMDSLGTVLVACLAGPVAGCITGVVGTAVFSINNPVMFCYLAVAAAIGFTAGKLTKLGFMNSPSVSIMGGFITGILAAVISAPITAWVYAGTTGGGTDFVVAAFRALGLSSLESCFAQGMIVDSVDKMVSFFVVQSIIAAMPYRLRSSFPQGEALGKMVTVNWTGRKNVQLGHGERRDIKVSENTGDIYKEGTGWLYNLSPTTKVCFALLCMLAAITLPAVVTVPETIANGGTTYVPRAYLPLLAAVIFSLAIVGGVGVELGKATCVMALPIAVSMVLINGLFGGSDSQCVWRFISWSYGNSMMAFGLAMRVVIIVEAVGLVLLSTRCDVLLGDLERRGLPARIAYVFLASLRLVPTMIRRAGEILEAQTSRAMPLGNSLYSRCKVLLPMAGPLLLGAIAEVEERALALEARGFGSIKHRTWWSNPPATVWDLPLQIAFAIIAVLLVLFYLFC